MIMGSGVYVIFNHYLKKSEKKLIDKIKDVRKKIQNNFGNFIDSFKIYYIFN